MRGLFDWLFWSEGSTRTVGLVRIGLVALLWDKYGSDFLLFRMDDAPWKLAIAGSFYVATGLLFFGLWTRVAAAWTALTMLTVFFGMGVNGGMDDFVHHHTFLLTAATTLLALTPCDRSFSVDRWWAMRRAEARGEPAPLERGPLFGQRLLAMQISAVYLFATYDKLTPGFLSGARLQHILIDRYGSSDPVTIPGFATFCLLGGVGTVVIEGALAIGLWIPRVQRPLIVIGVLFHAMLFVALPVATFSATMCLLYLAFLDPAVVHRAIDRMLGRTDTPAASRAEAA